MNSALNEAQAFGLELPFSYDIKVEQLRIPPHENTMFIVYKTRPLQDQLHLLTPDLGAHVHSKQAHHNQRQRDFNIGQTVWAQNRCNGIPWPSCRPNGRTHYSAHIVY